MNYSKRQFTLPKEMLDRFDEASRELELEPDMLLELTLELFLSSSIKKEALGLDNPKKIDC